ncbi:DNA polymerase III subunit alpha [Siminovitchia sp. 179-K 8D1 HS]|uniref:DNA polymerase III subunit alpha n=1 Tax=Siminovitchia sp. 179-K 8D1 HS TaxID=3142385 RepID=UPI0039A158CA
MNFPQLNISTAYSMLSSTISIPALVDKAKRLNYPALAMTDHHVLYGVLPFYKACMKAEIKPIIGMAADVGDEEESSKIILLAENNAGYANLLKISSCIQMQQSETIPWEKLQLYNGGLFAVLIGSEAGRRKDDIDLFLKIFGKHFYIGLQNYGRYQDHERMTSLSTYARSKGIPVVAANDVRYLDKNDAFAYHCLLAIRDGNEVAAEEAGQTEGIYDLKSHQELGQLFSDFPEALQNAIEIAEKCNVMIETNRSLLPKYPVPAGESAGEMLRRLTFQGLKERNIDHEAYVSRLKYELHVIHEMGFDDYFLIVWDFMKYARGNGILTGPGRGSAAGSLVAYSLGITEVDPIKYGLLFERFLNPERISLPDIDIDFPDIRRDQVIQYVVEKYGKAHVAHIITFGTFAAKAAIRDTARAFGFHSKELDMLSNLIPGRLGLTLKRAYEESERLRKFVNESGRNRLLFETALKIEGLPRHASTHAAGIIISDHPLVDIIPVKAGPDGTPITQYPMEDLEEIGLLKMDFLGLRNLTLLEQMMKSIQIDTGKEIRLEDIPFSDEKTFALLQKGDTTGIFQLESGGMRKVLRDLRPTEFEDIVAVNALFRPGPMENIPVYIARKHGKEKVQYPHPDLEPILDFTYGVIVYQEQIMQIASKMSGFSLGEADLLRRAVSKKKKEVLDQQRGRFVTGAVKNGYDEKTANDTYDLIVRFANYGFNRSHAVAYSFIAWQLSWLKAHYPKHFMAALLTSVIGNEDKIALYAAEAKQKGIDILPPSINKSHYPFKPEGKGIRFSLGAIRGLGAAALKEIIRARRNRPFDDLFDFCLRVSPRMINRKILESLVHSGCFDEFGHDRAVLLATLDVAIEHGELMRPSQSAQTEDLFVDETMFQFKPKYIEVEPIGLAEKLAFEKRATGIFLSDHPASTYKEDFSSKGAVDLIKLSPGRRNVAVGVYLAEIKTIRTKKGDMMAFATLSDASGEMEAVIFPDVYKRHMKHLKKGEIVLAAGYVEERNNQMQFIIQSVAAAEDLGKTDQKILYLKITEQLHETETLNKLKIILKKYPGETGVILYYEKKRQTIRLGEKNLVNPSENCLKELQSLLGDPCVKLK